VVTAESLIVKPITSDYSEKDRLHRVLAGDNDILYRLSVNPIAQCRASILENNRLPG
jgi:hypothetical protein